MTMKPLYWVLFAIAVAFILWAVFADAGPLYDCGLHIPSKACRWWN